MGTASIKFSIERLMAFCTTSNLEDQSFLLGFFPLGRLPSLQLRSPVYSPVSLSRDPNPGTTHWVSGRLRPKINNTEFSQLLLVSYFKE
jgi:hypothetical protein